MYFNKCFLIIRVLLNRVKTLLYSKIFENNIKQTQLKKLKKIKQILQFLQMNTKRYFWNHKNFKTKVISKNHLYQIKLKLMTKLNNQKVNLRCLITMKTLRMYWEKLEMFNLKSFKLMTRLKRFANKEQMMVLKRWFETQSNLKNQNECLKIKKMKNCFLKVMFK